MKKKMRVEYIDKLKGFAIFWVVMGHVAQYSLGIRDGFFNYFYSSFLWPCQEFSL